MQTPRRDIRTRCDEIASLRILKGRFTALHDEEGGAIMLAALAGTLILLMVSLALYDAGTVMRKKVNVQVAADTAAYGQAAIKARTMNTNAYANVAKRSIVAVAEVYHASYSLYVRDMYALALICSRDPAANAAACAEAGLGSAQNGNPTNNPCATNPAAAACASGGSGKKGWFLATHESFYDWDDLASPAEPSNGQEMGGFVIVYKRTSPLGQRVRAGIGTYAINALRPNSREIEGSVGKYNKELQQLTRYQEYMQKVTPWWAYMESVSRAAHNGATFAMSYPPPPALDPSSLPSWIQIAQTRMSSAGNANQSTGYTDWRWEEPALGRDVSLATNLRRPWNGERNLDNLRAKGRLQQRLQQSSDALEMCYILRESHGPGVPPYEDEGLNKEMQYNYAVMRENSEDTAKRPLYTNAFGHEDFNDPNTPILGGYSLCVMDMLGITSGRASSAFGGSFEPFLGQPSNPNGYVPAINPYFAGPYIVTVERDQTALDMLRLSNIVFTYREGKAVKEGRKRFGYIAQEYTDNLPDPAKGAGSWTIARSEIVTLGKYNGTLGRLYSSGEWHTNWTARIRPVAFKNEFGDLSADLPNVQESFINAAFRDAFPYVGMLQQKGLTRDFDQDQAYEDLQFMERATHAMDDNSTQGFFK